MKYCKVSTYHAVPQTKQEQKIQNKFENRTKRKFVSTVGIASDIFLQQLRINNIDLLLSTYYVLQTSCFSTFLNKECKKIIGSSGTGKLNREMITRCSNYYSRETVYYKVSRMSVTIANVTDIKGYDRGFYKN